MSRMVSVAATGDVVAVPCRLLSVTITHTAAVGVVTVRDGSGGTVFLTLRCVADGASVWRASDRKGIPIKTTLNVASITGTASIEYA